MEWSHAKCRSRTASGQNPLRSSDRNAGFASCRHVVVYSARQWPPCRLCAPLGRTCNGCSIVREIPAKHERKVAMGARRRGFLLSATLAAAVSVTAAFGQAVTPAAGPSGSAAQSAAPIPDFSGIWSHPYWPGFEPPASGPGPVTNRLRLRGGPQRGVSDPRQLVAITPIRS